MNLRLLSIDDAERARALLPLLERAAQETAATWREDPLPEGTVERFLERALAAPETLIVAAEDVELGEALAVVASAPFQDPLTGETRPMIILLYVTPDIRHHGVARALIGELQRRLGQRGHKELLARAGHNDDALISMGERLGLVRTIEIMSLE